MNLCISKMLKKMRLVYMWVFRIFFAKNHFKVSFFKKLRANIFGGYLADQHVLYDFDNNDRKQYLSEFDWYRSRKINDPFLKMMDNKIMATEVLSHYVNVPKIHVAQNRYRILVFNDKITTYEDIVKLLKTDKKLYIKPISAGKGENVFLLSYSNDIIFVNQTAYDESDFVNFLKKKHDWLITEAIEQGKYLNSIYKKTTNTIRLITMRDPETNKNKVFFAVQRIGVAKSIPVDNGSKGGLIANIDLETGVLSEARSLHSLDAHIVHPDSKSKIKGLKVPNWDELKNTMLNLADKFPFMHFIAWDVLLTEDGICVIEANSSSGVNIIQIWGPQRYNELGDFFRYHDVIK